MLTLEPCLFCEENARRTRGPIKDRRTIGSLAVVRGRVASLHSCTFKHPLREYAVGLPT